VLIREGRADMTEVERSVSQSPGIRPLRARFWIGAGLTGLTSFLFVLTASWKTWIEAFGVDPDNRRGLMEWTIVGVLAALAVTSGVFTKAEWSRQALFEGSAL
jgi:hypothetical protein